MLSNKSRYRDTPLFSPDDDGQEVFAGLRARSIGPATGVIEHEVQEGNRLEHLAQHYYNDPRAWWRIVDANPGILYAGTLLDAAMAGQVILIPKMTE